jgi:hypothetical protein
MQGEANVVVLISPYKIPADENGNSVLTGDAANTEYGYFTCKEVEVFLVFE